MVQHCQFPPLADQDAVVCCKKALKPGACTNFGSSKWKIDILDEGDIFSDKTFWCYYCFCGGVGVSAPFTHGVYAHAVKKLFCKGSANLENFVQSSGATSVYCGEVSSCCCIWRECQCMPEPGNPKVACCTIKANKEEYVCQAPAQSEMQ